MSGNKTVVEGLIAKSANVDENLDNAGTPLHVAIRNCGQGCHRFRHQEVVEVLLAAGANVHLPEHWAGTPLHDAAQLGFDDFAEQLISHGADVNSKKHAEGCAPLHLAAVDGRLGMIDYLLSRGAEIDVVSTDPFAGLPVARPGGHYIGKTPLHLAAGEGLVEVVRRLLERGATLDMRAAIDLASQSRRELQYRISRLDEIIRLLSS
jgi:cytohesin